MKVAICLYGQPRLYEEGYNVIKDFMEHNDDCVFDFFFHTWYSESLVGQYYQCAPWRNIKQEDLLIKKNTIAKLVDLYKPKKCMYEPPKIFDKNHYINSKIYVNSSEILKQNANNTLSALYSRQCVSDLLQSYSDNVEEKYDIVISIRFDFLNKLNFKLNTMKNNKINVMNVFPRLYLADHIVISDFDNFIKYSNAFNNLDKIFIKLEYKKYLEDVKCGYNFINESLTTANLLIYYNDLRDVIHMNSSIPNFLL
jgi:hypothetical protein